MAVVCVDVVRVVVAGVVDVRVVAVRDGVVVVLPGVVLDGVVAVEVGLVAVCPGTVEAGAAGPAGAVVVAVAVVAVAAGGATAAGGAVSTTAVGVVPAAAPSSPVSFTNANASSAPATRTIAPIATVGSCQFGVGARRVRAGAPHSRHQSCSGPSVAEQRGQRSEPGGGSWPGASGGCALTSRRQARAGAASPRSAAPRGTPACGAHRVARRSGAPACAVRPKARTPQAQAEADR